MTVLLTQFRLKANGDQQPKLAGSTVVALHARLTRALDRGLFPRPSVLPKYGSIGPAPKPYFGFVVGQPTDLSRPAEGIKDIIEQTTPEFTGGVMTYYARLLFELDSSDPDIANCTAEFYVVTNKKFTIYEAKPAGATFSVQWLDVEPPKDKAGAVKDAFIDLARKITDDMISSLEDSIKRILGQGFKVLATKRIGTPIIKVAAKERANEFVMNGVVKTTVVYKVKGFQKLTQIFDTEED